MKRTAVLMTCHNRKDTTLKCLNLLYKQKNIDLTKLDVFLVDDGSQDGTSETVSASFDNINILQGDGNLYWCGGMRLAWAEAEKYDYEFYFWLNDDTMLFQYAFHEMLITLENRLSCSNKGGIIVGSTVDSEKKISYGGYLVGSSSPLVPGNTPQKCDRMNGNLVLIPRDVFLQLGNLSSNYTHSMGDMDYSFRAKKKGIPLWVAPGFQGACKPNPGSGWFSSDIPFLKRWKILHSPKGIPPKEYIAYLKVKNKKWRVVDLFKLYLRVFFPQLWFLKGLF
jgi:GT2 family glycosyltransferase